jgi:hypothetical protein
MEERPAIKGTIHHHAALARIEEMHRQADARRRLDVRRRNEGASHPSRSASRAAAASARPERRKDMTRLRKWLSYGNVTATLAVFLAISGTAAAVTLAPANSVVSGSIKDGEVRPPDLAGAAVTGPKLRDDAVRGGKVADGSLSGADVRDGSLAGVDLAANSVDTDSVQDNAITGAKIADGAIARVKIAKNAVNGAKIADGTVESDDIGDASIYSSHLTSNIIGSDHLQDESVGSDSLKGVHAVVGEGVAVNAGTAHSAAVYCPPREVVIAGGYAWQIDGVNSIISSTPYEPRPSQIWVVRGMVPSGGPNNTLHAWASCLRP